MPSLATASALRRLRPRFTARFIMPWISSQLSPSRSLTAFWLAALSQSIASRSNKAVNRLDGSAHGSFTARTPCVRHSALGGFACRIVWY